MAEKIKIGGFGGIIHTALAFILSIISFIDEGIKGDSLIWNVLVFNAPVLIDFTHVLLSTPNEKLNGKLKSLCWIILVGLGVSVLLSFLCVGINCTIADITTNVFATGILIVSYVILKVSFILNPVGVFLNYVCSILTEEHRRNNSLGDNNE